MASFVPSGSLWRHLQIRVDRLEQQWTQMKISGGKVRSFVTEQLGPMVAFTSFSQTFDMDGAVEWTHLPRIR